MIRRSNKIYNPTLEKRDETVRLKKSQLVGQGSTYIDHPCLYEPLPQPFTMPDYQVSTDSGAHTLYKKFFVQGEQATEYARMTADYSYLETPEFKKFLDNYIQHLLDFKDKYTFYVTLDIINNPEKSWEITKYIESFGLSPIPVFHNGEDIKWLHKMLDEYPYLGISGLGQDINKARFKNFGDACFNAICDSTGKPRVKVHGFAMGTPDILATYPWYSADQSTWTYMSRVGSLLVPRPIFKGGKITGFDYLTSYKVLPVTNRRRFEPLHLQHVKSELTLQWYNMFLEQEGFTLEDVSKYYHIRDIVNIRLFNRIQQAAKSHYAEHWDYGEGGNILYAGTPSGASSNLSRNIRLLYDTHMKGMHWLGTPVYKKMLTNCLTIREACMEHQDLRLLWDENDAKMKVASVLISKPPKIEQEPITGVPKRKELKKKSFEITTTFTVTVPDQLNVSTAELSVLEQLKTTFPGMNIQSMTTTRLKEAPDLSLTPSFENLL